MECDKLSTPALIEFLDYVDKSKMLGDIDMILLQLIFKIYFVLRMGGITDLYKIDKDPGYVQQMSRIIDILNQ
jgi:hypothetical protein